MLETLIAVMVLLVFDFLILRFGADSRDGSDWVNHRPMRRI